MIRTLTRKFATLACVAVLAGATRFSLAQKRPVAAVSAPVVTVGGITGSDPEPIEPKIVFVLLTLLNLA